MPQKTVEIIKGWPGRPTGSTATVSEKTAKKWIADKVARAVKKSAK